METWQAWEIQECHNTTSAAGKIIPVYCVTQSEQWHSTFVVNSVRPSHFIICVCYYLIFINNNASSVYRIISKTTQKHLAHSVSFSVAPWWLLAEFLQPNWWINSIFWYWTLSHFSLLLYYINEAFFKRLYSYAATFPQPNSCNWRPRTVNNKISVKL